MTSKSEVGANDHQPSQSARAAQDQTLAAQNSTIDELETPVIEVWDGILALPIIGTVDTTRAQKMTERLLQRVVDTKSEIVILDITGCP